MGEHITLKVNGGTTAAYLARPSQGGGPPIVVIQEYWGLVPHIEKVTDRFAAAGFIALAPDLYHGEKAKSPDAAGKLMMAMRIDQAARDLAAAVDTVASQPGVTTRKVGTVGSAWAARFRFSPHVTIRRSAHASFFTAGTRT